MLDAIYRSTVKTITEDYTLPRELSIQEDRSKAVGVEAYTYIGRSAKNAKNFFVAWKTKTQPSAQQMTR